MKQYIITTMFDDVLYCFCFVLAFVWCPCMAINVVSVQYDGGLLPDIILLTQCYYHEEVLYLQPDKRALLLGALPAVGRVTRDS